MKKNVSRINRLNSASEWVKTYTGGNKVKGYCKKYGVDKLCAIKELRLLGVEITEKYESEIRRSIEDLKKQRQHSKEKKKQELNSTLGIDCDENFAFIAGYTSGGFAFGITHEEMEEIEKNELAQKDYQEMCEQLDYETLRRWT